MFSRATGAPRSLYLLCAIALLLAAPARSSAQVVGTEAGTVRAATTAPDTEVTLLNLLVGRSAVVDLGRPITRVSLTRPEIADAMVTGSQQILVHGKAPGTISMFIWDRSGGIKRYDVTVARDLTQLNQQLRQLFPGESISVTGSGKDVVVSGTVSSKYVMEKAVEVAAGYVDKKEDVVNLLRQQEGVATNQVLLRVRFAEVSRTAVTELGASLFTGPGGYRDYVARSTTQQFAAPNFDQMNRSSAQGADQWGGGRDTVLATGGNQTFSDFLNLFLFNNRYNVGALIRALQSRGLFQSLAEPNLVTENGKEASFLAGGEYPYPVVQGTGSNLAVTIQFKEYGIRLNFTPTLVGGDLVHLKVRPEVSSLDFSNAVTYQGFRIPSLTTRRADTEIELQDGQTFAIAGLLNNTVASTMQKIPGIGDIPILGLLFRSKAAQKGQTELVVMITPQILRRGAMGAATGLPNLVEPYLPPPKKTLPQPPARLPGGAPQQGDTTPPAAPVAATTEVAAPAPPIATPGVSPAKPAPAAVVGQPPPTPAQQAPPSPSPSRSPVVAQPAKTSPPVPPSPAVTPAPAAPPSAPKVDERKLAQEREAAARAAELKKAQEREAEERAAKALKQKQEADARDLARREALDAKKREADAKAAEERKKAEAAQAARAAELKKAQDREAQERAAKALKEKQEADARELVRQQALDAKNREAEAKAAEEKRKAEIRLAEEQGRAERARLELARKQAQEALEQEEKAARERAKRDAKAAKQAAELQRKQTEAENKRLKEVQDAVDRLNAAQAAYQAAVAKTKKGPGQQ